MLGAAVTSVSGSSAYFVGGVIAYSNDVKTRLLDVDEATLDEHGAVSPETARQMAVGARQATGADIGVSVTGIAGPGGGSRRKPVGTVFIGVSASTGPDVPEASVVGEYHFAGTRESIREQTVAAALTAALNTLCD
jgi:nicotinamide-nucleotide amidase